MQIIRVYENNRINTFKDIRYDIADNLKSLINKYDSSLNLDHIKIASGKNVFNDFDIKIQTVLFYGKSIVINNYLINLVITYQFEELNTGFLKLIIDSRQSLSSLKLLIIDEIKKKENIKSFFDIISINVDAEDIVLNSDEPLISQGIKDGSKFNVKFKFSSFVLYVKTLTEKLIQIPIPNDDLSITIESIKYLILDSEGIPTGMQRLVFAGHQLEDSKSLHHYNIKNKSTIHLILSLRGGGGFSFANIENDPTKLRWNSKAPNWRIAKPGLCLEGRCSNSSCKAFNNMVIMNIGLPIVYQLGMIGQKPTNCPICNQYVKPITCGFNNCEWRYIGLKETKNGIERVESDWQKVPDEYHRFNDDENSLVSWSSLVIETRFKQDDYHAMKNISSSESSLTNDEICAICLLEIEFSKQYVSSCKHMFHNSCISGWINIKSDCPLCRTTWTIA